MTRLLPLLLAAALAAPAAASPFAGVAPVADAELAQMRGGILLPNGLQVAIGISIETRIDGQLALRTSVSTEQPGVMVASGGAATSGGGTQVAISTWAPPTVITERDRAGTTISAAPGVPVTVTIGGGDGGGAPTGGTPLDLAPGGPGVATAFGEVRLADGPRGAIVTLIGPTIEVRQLIGQATGVVVANSASNRAIDTVAQVNVELQGAGMPLSNLGSRLEGALLGAASRGLL